MRTVLLFAGIAVMTLITVSSCGGSGDDSPPPPPAEANLAVTTDPAHGSVQPPALGPYTLKVTITSTMPPNGVKIDITAKKDDGTNTVFFTTSVNRTTAVNDFTITGTPVATQCLVETKVTSLTKPTNTWSGSYRYSSK
ncbi:MAG TPA: hypothetical protein VFD56_01660 [Chitinophagaceae bacterium]|nr:hypothetical protein [Chitinophagaceae bacterium]